MCSPGSNSLVVVIDSVAKVPEFADAPLWEWRNMFYTFPINQMFSLTLHLEIVSEKRGGEVIRTG